MEFTPHTPWNTGLVDTMVDTMVERDEDNEAQDGGEDSLLPTGYQVWLI
jgi:hypothetical protein